MEDEINNICRTFSLESKNQEKNLIDSLWEKLIAFWYRKAKN